MASRLLDYDPLTGIESIWHYDPATEDTTIEERQVADLRLDLNKDEFNSFDGKHNAMRGDFVKVASIPLVVWADLVKRGIADDPVALKRWLNDPDNRYFRTAPGKL